MNKHLALQALTSMSAEAGLLQENLDLRARVAILEASLQALVDGDADALYLKDAKGERVLALDGADRAFRLLIEEMGEGALTLTAQGIVAYANRSFARILRRPLEQVIGAQIQPCFAPEAGQVLEALLEPGRSDKRSAELDMITAGGVRLPVFLSVSTLPLEGLPDALCMVVIDLTERKRGEAAIQARQTLLRVIEEQRRMQEDLQVHMEMLRLRDNALGAISQGVLICDGLRRITYANDAFVAITGYPLYELVGRPCDMLQGHGTDPSMPRRMREAMRSGRPFHGELLNYRKDGTPFWNDLSITPVIDAGGVTTQFVGVIRDATARRRAEGQLLLAGEVFEQSTEGLIITDADSVIVKVNRAFTAITGYTPAEVVGHRPSLLRSARHDAPFFETMWREIDLRGRWSGEIWNRRKDGSEYPEWLSLSRVVDAAGQVTHYIASFSDITQRKAAEERIRHLAHYDALTALPNRALLADRVVHALQMARRRNQPMALMFVDLDHFKNVNDSLGHRVGDGLLVAIAKRMKAALRDEDTLARVGGDEFVLVLPDTDASGAAHVADKLLRSASEPFLVETHELTLSASVGIALYPTDGVDHDGLARCADVAMYRAKDAGRNAYRFYTAEMQAQSARALQLESGLRRALERNEFSLQYQPQLSLADELIVGAEALLRWEHPELGWVSPGEFIPIAESSGQIAAIGEWVIRTAARQMHDWRDAGMDEIVMAVNLSAVQFRQHDIVESVLRILSEAGVAPQCLELELTESVASDDPLGAIEVMNRLHASGVRMTIDDFGTGYSSLNYLKRFKVGKLKIDQSFVQHLTEDGDDQSIVRAIVHLAHSMGMRTVAEGVETPAQLDYLRSQGCDEIQGYWLSRPLVPEQFSAFMNARRPVRPARA